MIHTSHINIQFTVLIALILQRLRTCRNEEEGKQIRKGAREKQNRELFPIAGSQWKLILNLTINPGNLFHYNNSFLSYDSAICSSRSQFAAQRSSSAEEDSEDLNKPPSLKSLNDTHSAVYLVPTESLAWEDTQSVSGCFETSLLQDKAAEGASVGGWRDKCISGSMLAISIISILVYAVECRMRI